MANKAVLLSIGAGMGVYSLMERYHDKEAERERQQKEQALRERQENADRLFGERMSKEGNSFEGMRNVIHDGLNAKEFHAKVFSHLEEMLYNLVVKVGERAPRGNWDYHMLNLPLIGHECDKEELMLAAAFALGSADVIDKIFDSFSTRKLGIGLKKFSKKSIMDIIDVLESVKIPDIDHTGLSMFTACGVFKSGLRGYKPCLVVPCKNPPYSDNLCKWGEEFGVHVNRLTQLERVSRMQNAKGRAKFRFREVHRGNEYEYGRAKSEKLVLSNFYCSFDAPYTSEYSDPSPDGIRKRTCKPDLNKIRLSKSNHKAGRCKPKLDVIAHATASKIVADMSHEAAKRLKQFLKKRGNDDSISLEHIALNAGKVSHLLQNLAKADIEMIRGHVDNIESTLSETLLQCVALPDKNELIEGESPKEKLATEVSTFVNTYIQLLNFSYCEIPRLSGRPPSAFVPKFSPLGQVTQHEDCFVRGIPVMIRTVTRLQVKEERDRLLRSRELVAPGPHAIRYFIATVSMTMFWICEVALRPFSFYKYHIPGLRYVVGLALACWALGQSFKMFGKFCHLPVNHDESSLQYCWRVASHCTEVIQRTIAIKLGRPTPYDQKMSELRQTCVSMHSAWRLRIARRNFQAALKRKRITNKESVLLLTEMADRCFETDDEEVIEGVFQAELNEVEQFLKLQVEEGVLCTEVALSPDAAVKNYLNFDEEETKVKNSLAQLCNLGDIVEECVFFGEGDRVKVQIDEGGHEVTASVVFSTASLVYVHLDGVPAESPTAVPIHRCSVLVEDLPLLKDTPELDDRVEDFSSSASDGSDSESVGVAIVTNEDHKEDSEEIPSVPQSQTKSRVSTVEEALIDGGWVLKRSKKHIKYSRRVKLTKDGPAQKQTVTLSKTPSDWRAERNKLSLLRRLNDGVIASSAPENEGQILTPTANTNNTKQRSRRKQRKTRAW